MSKQNILALALKPAIRVTKSVGIGIVLLLAAALIAIITPSAASAPPPCEGPTATLLVTGLQGAIGQHHRPRWCAVRHRRRSRQDLARRSADRGENDVRQRSAESDSIGIGGAIDVAFIDNIAYVLVTLVGAQFGSSDVVGIYRVDGPDSFTVVADIGAFNLANPPTIPFQIAVPTGLQFALQTYRGGFLVTDGHLNRVLRVTLDGEITVLIAFDNIVPTGLEVRAIRCTWPRPAPSPTCPRTARLCRSGRRSPTATEVASGARLLVDVEFGRGRRLYALSQAYRPGMAPAGTPAVPNTGALVKVNGDGTFTVITDGLDQPTSLEFIGNTAYVVTLTGEIWKIDGVSCPPYGVSR